jgi:hypothetical protein
MKAYAVYKHDLSNASGVQRFDQHTCDCVVLINLEGRECARFACATFFISSIF